jgi:beta-mannanase
MVQSTRSSTARVAAILAPIVAAIALCAPASAAAAVTLGFFSKELSQSPETALDRFAAETGASAKIAMYYRDWSEGWPTALIDPHTIAPIVASGAVPMITWEPFLSSAPPQSAQAEYAPSRIAAGAFDPYIWRAAREAAAYGRPFFLRFAEEMNGGWSSWGVKPGSSAAAYVAMWRHVVSIFRAAGATNVRWVWSPNVYGANGVAAFAPYYPGDAWVDDVGLDGYNWGGVNDSAWLSFGQVFGASYEAMTKLTSKPLLITETASSELGGSKPEWIAGIRSALFTRMPRVRALIWFDTSKETNWTVGSSPASLRAFRGLVAAGTFSGTPPMSTADSAREARRRGRARSARLAAQRRRILRRVALELASGLPELGRSFRV